MVSNLTRLQYPKPLTNPCLYKFLLVIFFLKYIYGFIKNMCVLVFLPVIITIHIHTLHETTTVAHYCLTLTCRCHLHQDGMFYAAFIDKVLTVVEPEEIELGFSHTFFY